MSPALQFHRQRRVKVDRLLTPVEAIKPARSVDGFDIKQAQTSHASPPSNARVEESSSRHRPSSQELLSPPTVRDRDGRLRPAETWSPGQLPTSLASVLSDAIAVPAEPTVLVEARGHLPLSLRRAPTPASPVREADALVVVGHVNGVVTIVGVTATPRHTLASMRTYTTLHNAGAVTAVAMVDGIIASGDECGTLRVTDPERDAVIGTANVLRAVTSVSLHNHVVAAGTAEGVVFIFQHGHMSAPAWKLTCTDEDPVVGLSVDSTTGDIVFAQSQRLCIANYGSHPKEHVIVSFPAPAVSRCLFADPGGVSGIVELSTGVAFAFSDDDVRGYSAESGILDRGWHLGPRGRITLRGPHAMSIDAEGRLFRRGFRNGALGPRVEKTFLGPPRSVSGAFCGANPCWLLVSNQGQGTLDLHVAP